MKILYKRLRHQGFLLILFLMSGVVLVSASSIIEKETRNVLKDGFTSFQKPYGSWYIKNNQLILGDENPPKKRTNLWINQDYEDFILELDFKLNPKTNSGVFFRTADTDDPVQTGIEVQLRDDYNKSPVDKHFCGSVYEIKEVSENRVKSPGKWNHLKIICNGNNIEVHLNQGKVVDIDLSQWSKAGINPDGTENKFHTAYKDMPEKGKVGFQDHGGKIWLKNIKITEI